ncbi:hypothetical protein O181_024096 [Austropuccinia psidii MF-1]|uniref:Uncharacterized protein n=1 Tax=Austropuccinia psidii MF-1 TaxID=1389203 RepID=A0A9Q3CG10_9BASI|nr:hypothetical protein [Austropuccinia psidii MF-1]
MVKIWRRNLAKLLRLLLRETLIQSLYPRVLGFPFEWCLTEDSSKTIESGVFFHQAQTAYTHSEPDLTQNSGAQSASYSEFYAPSQADSTNLRNSVLPNFHDAYNPHATYSHLYNLETYSKFGNDYSTKRIETEPQNWTHFNIYNLEPQINSEDFLYNPDPHQSAQWNSVSTLLSKASNNMLQVEHQEFSNPSIERTTKNCSKKRKIESKKRNSEIRNKKLKPWDHQKNNIIDIEENEPRTLTQFHRNDLKPTLHSGDLLNNQEIDHPTDSHSNGNGPTSKDFGSNQNIFPENHKIWNWPFGEIAIDPSNRRAGKNPNENLEMNTAIPWKHHPSGLRNIQVNDCTKLINSHINNAQPSFYSGGFLRDLELPSFPHLNTNNIGETLGSINDYCPGDIFVTNQNHIASNQGLIDFPHAEISNQATNEMRSETGNENLEINVLNLWKDNSKNFIDIGLNEPTSFTHFPSTGEEPNCYSGNFLNDPELDQFSHWHSNAIGKTSDIFQRNQHNFSENQDFWKFPLSESANQATDEGWTETKDKNLEINSLNLSKDNQNHLIHIQANDPACLNHVRINNPETHLYSGDCSHNPELEQAVDWYSNRLGQKLDVLGPNERNDADYYSYFNRLPERILDDRSNIRLEERGPQYKRYDLSSMEQSPSLNAEGTSTLTRKFTNSNSEYFFAWMSALRNLAFKEGSAAEWKRALCGEIKKQDSWPKGLILRKPTWISTEKFIRSCNDVLEGLLGYLWSLNVKLHLGFSISMQNDIFKKEMGHFYTWIVKELSHWSSPDGLRKKESDELYDYFLSAIHEKSQPEKDLWRVTVKGIKGNPVYKIVTNHRFAETKAALAFFRLYYKTASTAKWNTYFDDNDVQLNAFLAKLLKQSYNSRTNDLGDPKEHYLPWTESMTATNLAECQKLKSKLSASYQLQLEERITPVYQ